MGEQLEVFVDSIRVSLTTQQRVLMLREPKHNLYLPIWIGSFEAESIIVGLQEIEVSRPQPHDLLKKVITSLGATLKRVELTKIQDDTFYSALILEADGKETEVDCRPSDGISLAIRFGVSIYANVEVLYSVGIQPEKDISQPVPVQDDVPFEAEEEYAADDTQLSVFDDFLRKLDFPDSDTGDNAGKDSPQKPDNEDDTPDDLLSPE